MNTTVGDGAEPQPVYALVFGCILVLGLPLNAVSLWTFLRHHGLGTPSTVFMVNLATSDLLLVVSLPMRVYFYATGTWPLNGLACFCTDLLFRGNFSSSFVFITSICVDRLLAVVYPLRSRRIRTSSNASRVAALVWLLVLVVNVPGVMHHLSPIDSNNKSSCFEFSEEEKPYRSGKNIFMFLLRLIMLAVNVVCTALVSRALHKRPNASAMVNNKVNVMLIFVVSLVMLTVCFLPLFIALFLSREPDIVMPLICLASFNCCLDPLLYYFSLDAFWKKKEDADVAREE